jgi:membrane-bound serine protease (ClpP class)
MPHLVFAQNNPGVNLEMIFPIVGVVGFILIGIGFFWMLVMLLRPNSLFLQWAMCFILVGAALTFAMGFPIGVVTLSIVILTLPVVGAAAWYLWTQTPIGRQMPVLPSDSNVKEIPNNRKLEELLGQIGRTATVMRPCGKVEFNGNGDRIDAIAEAIMIEAGRMVRCIDVRAGKVVVRPVDPPIPGALKPAVFN